MKIKNTIKDLGQFLKPTYGLILLLIFLSSLTAISTAYISQYFFGLQPCILCVYQRIPFLLILLISPLFTISKDNENLKKLLIKISLFLIFINMLIAAYHVGVEQKIFVFNECANLIDNVKDIAELKLKLKNTKAVRCDEPQFYLFSITMAGWNVVYCLFIILFSSYFYRKI